MSKQEVILCKELENDLTHAIGKCPHDKLFILTDEHTHRLCLPQLQSIPALENAAENVRMTARNVAAVLKMGRLL